MSSGSRKKQKKSAKERKEDIIFETKGKVSQLSIHIDSASGNISMDDADTSKTISRKYYDKTSGLPKILTQHSLGGDGGKIDTNLNIQDDLTHLIAIDTNSIKINNCLYSAVVAYFTEEDIRQPTIHYSPLYVYLIYGHTYNHPIERMGWHLVLSEIKSRLKMGLVVDSYLDIHQDINARKTPYYKGVNLPENFTLVYASADKPNEGLANKMIHQCDAESSKILKSADAILRRIPREKRYRLKDEDWGFSKIYSFENPPAKG